MRKAKPHASETNCALLRNLGPATSRWLAAVGISSPAELFAQDPVAVGMAIRAAGYPCSLTGVYALAAARLGIDWRLLPDTLRTDLAGRWSASLRGEKAERTRKPAALIAPPRPRSPAGRP